MNLVNYEPWRSGDWRASTIELLPSLLGFSLGTYAILFSLLTSRLKRALKSVKNGNGIPYLDEINATFFHFIFVQTIALFLALSSRANVGDCLRYLNSIYLDEILSALAVLSMVIGYVGSLLTLYAVLLVIASALAIYRIASIVDPND